MKVVYQLEAFSKVGELQVLVEIAFMFTYYVVVLHKNMCKGADQTVSNFSRQKNLAKIECMPCQNSIYGAHEIFKEGKYWIQG